MNVVIPCTSSAPDRAHDAVVLAVDKPLLETLRVKRRAFETQSVVSLHAHEYHDSNIFYFRPDDEDDHVNSLGHPNEPVNLDEWLCGWGVLGPYHLEDAPNVYLKVVAEGFFYTWDGRKSTARARFTKRTCLPWSNSRNSVRSRHNERDSR